MSPIEGPGKQDFGDIDIFVAWPKANPTNRDEALSRIGQALGAERMARGLGQGVSVHFALPWPLEFSTATETEDGRGLEFRPQQREAQEIKETVRQSEPRVQQQKLEQVST